jgi:CO dehydrogenase maturation factor
VLYKLQKKDAYEELGSMPLPQKMEYLLNVDCLYEGDRFDMVTLGVKWTRGCYCQPNNVLQALLPDLAQNYDYTILDSPAGLEHINRRVIQRVDDVFVLIDPSAKALRNARRLAEIADAIGVSFGNLYLVGNYRFTRPAEKRVQDVDGATYLGRVEPDPDVQQFDWEGRSLEELPEDSPASLSVRKLLEDAGYAVA